jgi:FixJ family two-component response regulator
MNSESVRIFIVEDDLSLREALTILLKMEGYACEDYASAEAFLSREPFHEIGCIVLDVRMPGMSGLELQEELARRGWCVPIVFITAHGDIPMSVQAMKRGAVDFLPKPFDDVDLLQAVESAVEKNRKERADRSVIESIRRQMAALSPREYQVLRYVIAGFPSKRIADELKIAEQTVKIHRSHILQKLGVGSVAEVARMAEKAGLNPAGKN